MSYVDDILAVALEASSGWFYDELPPLVLIKPPGGLRLARKDIPSLGRVLHRDEAGLHLQAPKPYAPEMVDLLGLRTGKAVGTTGAATPTKKQGGASHLDYESHRLYRPVVGRLRWLVPTRPDLSYVPKELSRTLRPIDDCVKPKEARHPRSQGYGRQQADDSTHDQELFGGHFRRHHLHRLRLGRLSHC